MLIREFCTLHNIGRREVYRIKDKLGMVFSYDNDGKVKLTSEQCNAIKQEWELYKQTRDSKLFNTPFYTHDSEDVTLIETLSFLKDKGMTVILEFRQDYRINMLTKTREQQEDLYEQYLLYKEATSSHQRNTILNAVDRILS